MCVEGESAALFAILKNNNIKQRLTYCMKIAV